MTSKKGRYKSKLRDTTYGTTVIPELVLDIQKGIEREFGKFIPGEVIMDMVRSQFKFIKTCQDNTEVRIIWLKNFGSFLPQYRSARQWLEEESLTGINYEEFEGYTEEEKSILDKYGYDKKRLLEENFLVNSKYEKAEPSKYNYYGKVILEETRKDEERRVKKRKHIKDYL